jgi:hypothetical protein
MADKLAGQWELQKAVGSQEFARLTEGQHPYTEEHLLRHRLKKGNVVYAKARGYPSTVVHIELFPT